MNNSSRNMEGTELKLRHAFPLKGFSDYIEETNYFKYSYSELTKRDAKCSLLAHLNIALFSAGTFGTIETIKYLFS